ncbi:MAG: hypothetical protein MN733_34955, partial [Nitrososphaera sp.]|nr:hypothetical protein [Nitrososphaera sp.]
SVEMGVLREQDSERLVKIIQSVGLPTRAEGVSNHLVFRSLRYDKKFVHGRPRWILLTRIGNAVVSENVPPLLMKRVLRKFI